MHYDGNMGKMKLNEPGSHLGRIGKAVFLAVGKASKAISDPLQP